MNTLRIVDTRLFTGLLDYFWIDDRQRDRQTSRWFIRRYRLTQIRWLNNPNMVLLASLNPQES